ncbi:MAG: glycosyltransferase family 2 protein [Candidatus Omnitrophica bacterium]|nr:glycosyltransferase family 2 protein [Candidatus Omnitrophota bacterium]
MAKVPVSVVIIAKNEEKNLPGCLESVHGWADEIIVVDDESIDRTVEIAEQFGAKVFQRRMDNEGTHRNWAYDQARCDWVFSLDADERISPELRDEIDQTLPNAEFLTYMMPRRNYIGDYWVRHGGQYPAQQRRLFRKGKIRYEEVEVHPRMFVEGGHKGRLTKDIIHYSYKNIEHFLAKLNGQTTLEAKKWFQTNREMSFGRAVWRMMDRFPRTYLRKKGYKDGFYGFMFSFMASLYQIISYAKYWELKKKAQVSGTQERQNV